MSDARDIIEQLLRRTRGPRGPRGPNGPRTITPNAPNISWKAVIAGIVALIVLWTAASSIYTVQPDERAVIKRFGQGHRYRGARLELQAAVRHRQRPIRRNRARAEGRVRLP